MNHFVKIKISIKKKYDKNKGQIEAPCNRDNILGFAIRYEYIALLIISISHIMEYPKCVWCHRQSH